MLEQCAARNIRRQELRHRITLTFAYPVLLLGMIAVLLILCNMFIVDNLNSVFAISAWWCRGLRFSTSSTRYLGWTMLALAAGLRCSSRWPPLI